jgi:sec-independent protein translocase protein TatA
MQPVLAEIFGWEALLVLLIIALLFGSTRLPALARSLGEATRELRKGMSDEPDGAAEPGDEKPGPSPTT